MKPAIEPEDIKRAFDSALRSYMRDAQTIQSLVKRLAPDDLAPDEALAMAQRLANTLAVLDQTMAQLADAYAVQLDVDPNDVRRAFDLPTTP